MLQTYFENLLIIMYELSPWLLMGVLIAGLLHVLIPANFLNKQLGSNTFTSVFKAVLIGVPMPLCSCSVIPTAIGLRKGGASESASMGFLVSTPQTGIDSIFVSGSMLSWPFAIFKLISAFIIGLVAGAICTLSDSPKAPNYAPASEKTKIPFTLYEIYDYGINDLLYMVWRWLVIGVLISACITTFLPDNFFAFTKILPSGISSNGFLYTFLLSIIILFASLPMYVCATSSVPLAAAFIAKGMPASAALVFLIAGPASNIATVGMIYKSFGKKFLTIYLMSVSIGSLAFANCFDFILKDIKTEPLHQHIHGTSPITITCTIILCILILRFGYKDLKILINKKSTPLSKPTELIVTGLTCKGCINKLSTHLLKTKVVERVEIKLETGLSTIHSTLTYEELSRKVIECGFGITE